jgi:hypothetical protein
MATRKMTFSLPEDLARQLVRRVPSRDRSRFLARILERSLQEEDKALIRSCRSANEDPEVRTIEEELGAIADPLEEPWSDPAPR